MRDFMHASNLTKCLSGYFRIARGHHYAGLAKDPAVFEQKKLKEIKNGRLAMIACLGGCICWGSVGAVF